MELRAAPRPGGAGLTLEAWRGPAPVAAREVLLRLRDDADVRRLFNDTLAAAPYAAFRWETPAYTERTASAGFVCALIPSPELERPASPRAFADALARADGAPVVTLPNLSGDCLLVVPAPRADPGAYGHLAAFVRGAPADQRQALWAAVGAAMAARGGARPVWLSTAGAGVPWLHVRLDDQPKYYAHRPYRAPTVG